VFHRGLVCFVLLREAEVEAEEYERYAVNAVEATRGSEYTLRKEPVVLLLFLIDLISAKCRAIVAPDKAYTLSISFPD